MIVTEAHSLWGNASGTNTTNTSNSNATSQPAQSSNSNANTNLQSTDQQVQSIMNQLDGAHNDVNNSNAASSQDNGQQP